MKSIFTSVLGKSLLIFILSLLGSWNRGSLLSKLEQPSQTPLTLDIKNRSVVDLAVIPGLEVYSCFLWFLLMLFILEAISLALTGRCNKIERRSCTFFIKYYAKVLVRYSLCYFLYMLIFVVACFVCNMYTNTQKSSPVETTTSITKSANRNLQGTYSASSDINMGAAITGELISPSSSSIVTKSVFVIEIETNTELAQIIISSDNNTAFILTYTSQPENTSLQILNVTVKDSPSLIVNFPVFANDSSYYDDAAFSMVLSSDEKTLVIGTVYALQILDISNLTSPVSLGLISQVNVTYNYFNISPDAQTIFTLIYISTTTTPDLYGYNTFEIINISNATSPTIISSYNFPLSSEFNSMSFILSDDYLTVFLNNNSNIAIVNITNLQSPQLISSSIDNTALCAMQIYQGNLYLYSDLLYSLRIYNISDLSNPVSIANLSFSEPHGAPLSLSLAISDQLCFITYGKFGSPGLLRVLNISNNTASDIIGTFHFSNSDDIMQGTLAKSPHGRYIFFAGTDQLYVYDIASPESLIKVPQVQFDNSYVLYMTVSSDAKTLFLTTDTQLWVVQLNFNMEARQALDLLHNQVNSITVPVFSGLPVCSKINKLYVPNEFSGLVIFDITNPAAYVVIPSPEFPNNPYQITVSPDEKYLFGIVSIENSMNQVYHLAIYCLSNGHTVSSFQFATLPSLFASFVMTPDSDTVLILQGPQNFFILDVSNRTDIQLVSNTTNSELSISSVTLSNDGKTAFLISGNSSLAIYDISIPATPSLLVIYNELPGLVMSIVQSLDGNTLFITNSLSTSTGECTLNIIDISSLSSPTFVTAITLPDACSSSQAVVAPMISYEQTLFLPLNQSLAVIDVTLVGSPTPLNYYLVNQPTVIVSPDYSTLIVSSITFTNISLITLRPENILYSDLNSFPLGPINATNLTVFTRNPSNTYDIELASYKFTDMSLSVPIDIYGAMTQTYKMLPNWMPFDQNSGIITFSPNSGFQVGVYVLSGTLSKQIPNNTFIGIGPIKNESNSFNLFYTLVISGYLDNQGYLTSSFDSAQPLLLPPKYINQESLIRQRLAGYSIQASMPVYITQSLTLTLSDSPSSLISIDTLSLEPLNINITLEGNGNMTSQPKFVTTGYSFTASFSQNNTVVSLVMSLFDANTALSQLIVFLNGSQSCTGNITIIDCLNPTLTQIVPDISRYFYISSQPTINGTYFQSQLAKVAPKTGQQFVFQIDSSTFSDINNESLTLSIQMNDGSPVPEWVELKDLSIIGTFPEQITGREIDLILTVSNQYQSNKIGFTLDAGISIEYAFRLIGTYGGALITLIGLFVYAPHIYNILAKRRYRYSKEFTIRVGQEINSKVLYPIYFGLEPLRESKIIMSELDIKVALHIGNNNKAQIAAHFTGSNSDACKIDRVKLTEAIEHTADKIREKGKYKLRLYTHVLTPQKELINQLIINNYTLRLLDLDKAKDTKAAFNLIKPDVYSLVNLDKCLQDGLCVFSVNTTQLYSELRKYNIKTLSKVQIKEEEVIIFEEPSQDQHSLNSTEKDSLETELLHKPVLLQSRQSNANINIDLLIYGIEAYAFNQQIIDADILKTNVVTKERLAEIWSLAGIRRFLKLDLEPINLIKKERLGYGIKYNIQENCLIFYGRASKDIKGKTIVMQIITRRGKILREIWVHGVSADTKPEEELLVN